MVQHSNSSHVQLPTARTSSHKVRSSVVAAAAGLSVATVFNVLTIQNGCNVELWHLRKASWIT